MILRRWESWVVYTRLGEKVGERRIRRHFTWQGARRWGDSIVCRPDVLAKTLESALHGQGMLFVDAEVRRRPESPGRSGSGRIAPDAAG